MTTGRRLAYLCLETPRPGQATYTHVHEIIAGLRAIGWEVDLIATGSGGASSGSSYLARLRDYIGAQWRLMRRLGAYDGVYMRAHFAAWPAAAFASARSVPVFQEINGLPADIFVTYPWLGRLSGLVNWLYRSQMKMAAHVFVVTEGLKRWAQTEAGHERVSVVSNGANTALFNPEGPRPAGLGTYVAFVGGLTAWHGIATMIAATRQPNWPDHVRLVIIGDGVERHLLTGDSLGSRVHWLGRRPPEEVAAYLRGALAALSITEDSADHLATGVAPLKLFEAMASGAAVIVTDLPFQKELVGTHETGIVIPMSNPPALAGAVRALADDPDLARRLGRNGVAYVNAHATWAKRAGEISDVLTHNLDAEALPSR
ncbi:glycosyltransferase family 4 protein [Bosea sp. Leaf344]|uniref:glycosyltransferase family 4 protein n=1 Tax=Bosea sp. Leaf344 TaxID=1736346 RepID=UPI0009EB711D|nr:glycosyltransferase family 4 protein [Bosea sp. Leaf344]